MIGFFRRVDRAISRGEEALLAAFLAAMILVVFGDFALRVTVNQGWPWAKECAAYLMVWTGFLGATLAAYRRRHLVMSLPERIFPAAVRRWTYLSGGLLTTGLCLTIAWLGYRYVAEVRGIGERSLTLDIPLWWVQAIIPATFALLGLRFLGASVRILLEGPSPLGDCGPSPDEAAASTAPPTRPD